MTGRARVLRWSALVCCVAGVAGMIATNIAGNQDGALAFGLLTASGAGVILLLGVLAPSQRGVDEVAAHELEREIAELTAEGVDERRLRRVVTLARRLGQLPGDSVLAPPTDDGDPSG